VRMMVKIVAMVLAGALSAGTLAAVEPNNIKGAPALDPNRPDRAADAPGNQAGLRQAGPRERRPPATPRRRAGSVTQARGLQQHPVQSNGEALRSTLRAPAHGGGLRHPPMAGKAFARHNPTAGGNAPNSAQARPVSTGSVSAIAASGHVSSTQPIAPSAIAASGRVSGTQPIAPSVITAGRGVIGPQSVGSNGVPGNHRPPTGLVTIGGAVTNHNATRGVLDGNSVHRRF
jgi:hypothetical protein